MRNRADDHFLKTRSTTPTGSNLYLVSQFGYLRPTESSKNDEALKPDVQIRSSRFSERCLWIVCRLRHNTGLVKRDPDCSRVGKTHSGATCPNKYSSEERGCPVGYA